MRPRVSSVNIKLFLSKEFKNFSNFRLLKGGEISQVASFESDYQSFILKISSRRKDFLKDRYAENNFTKLPIPKTLAIGQFNKKYYYSISYRVNGKILDEINGSIIKKLTPKIIQSIISINKIYIPKKMGYGDWKAPSGKAPYKSWQNFLKSKINKDLPKKDREIFENLNNNIVSLAPFCPEEHCLLHGDFNYGNIFSDNKKIVGIIDWANSKYGDFVYDIAWLDFWFPKVGYNKLCYKFYKKNNFSMTHYNERLKCYQYIITSDALRWYIKSKNIKKYNLVKKYYLNNVIKNRI